MKALSVLLVLSLVGCATSPLERAAQIPAINSRWTPTPGDDLAGAYEALRARVSGWGFEIVEIVDPSDGAYGRITPSRKLIQVRTSIPINGQFEVLAHELGHLFQPASLDRAQGEVFAELVSMGVARHYGYRETPKNAAPYLAGLKGAFPAMRYLDKDVAYAVAVITGQQTWTP